MRSFLTCLIITFIVSSCASTQPAFIVDPSSVTDSKKVVSDREECYEIAKGVDMSDEIAGKAVGGALLGSGAVAGVAALFYGAVFAPAVPFIIAGGAAGGGLWGKSASDKEIKFRNNVLKQCMVERGYKVYTGEG